MRAIGPPAMDGLCSARLRSRLILLGFPLNLLAPVQQGET